MTRANLLPLAMTLPWLAAPILAAPAPKDPKPTPITAKNADRVRPVLEVAGGAYRIRRAPTRGELVVYNYNDAAEILDDVNLRPVRPLVKGRKPTDVVLSPDGKLLAWTENRKKGYTVEDLATGKSFDVEISDMAGFAAFSPDGKTLAIGNTYWQAGAHGVGHSEMLLFDVKGKLLHKLEKSGPGGLTPVFSPDGKTLAVGNRNYETQLFDVATGKLLHKLDKRMTQEIAFSPNGKSLACGYVDGTVCVWDVATGKALRSAESGCREIYSVDWSPKGDVLATSGHGGKILLWEPAGLTKLKELESPSWVIQVRFTADGCRLVTAGASNDGGRQERKLVLWAVAGGDK